MGIVFLTFKGLDDAVGNFHDIIIEEQSIMLDLRRGKEIYKERSIFFPSTTLNNLYTGNFKDKS